MSHRTQTHESFEGGLAGLLADRRRANFVGRKAELDLFRSALRADAPSFSVLNVYGPGGIGKTTLLDRFAELAHDAHSLVIRLDGRELAPTPAAVLDALAAHLNLGDTGTISVPSGEDRLVLLLDTFEMLEPLEDWLRTRLVPALPATAVMVVTGRRPLGSAWRADPGWRGLLRVVPLRNLDPTESRALLDAAGVDPFLHGRLVELTHGHPLGLSLVADLVVQGGAAEGDPLTPDLVGTLTRQFVDVVPSPTHRRVLEVCAVARVTTEAVVREVVDADDAATLFAWLRDLSFIDTSPDGVFPHDLARDALEADLRWRDPDAFAEVFRGVRDHIFARLRTATGREQQRALFDEKFLLRHQPDLMARLEWATFGAYYPEPARPDDLPTVHAITSEAEGPASAAQVQRWWSLQPEGFTVVRRPNGEIRGFNAILDLTRATVVDLSADPIVAAIWEHVQRHGPARAGEVVSLSRFAIDRDAYQGPSPTLNLAVVLSIQHFLQTANLAWWFVSLADPDQWDDYFRFSALPRAVGADVEFAGRRFGFFGNDFRRIPVDQWLELLTERALARDFYPVTAHAQTSPVLVLSRSAFDDAVRQALRDLHRPDVLATNPLLRSALIRNAAEQDGPSAETLVAVVHAAADTLLDDPKDAKLHRVLDRTYLRPAPTQERAAEVLDLPMSTYKRHLRRGIGRLASVLWEQELSAGYVTAGQGTS